jgi:hypothetical protein
MPVWREIAALALLLLMAAGIHGWLISHTEVAARDSVGFIRYALELERSPWKEALERNLQHPGYPLALLAVSWPVRMILGDTNSVSMQLSAQLASSLAGVLLVIPMYYLGRENVGRRASFWGTALFQCLPVSARVLSDGLSEATFLLFTTTALLFAVRGLRSRSVVPFVACGFFSGLAYLTRPEGALVVPATGLVLFALQLIPTWRRAWPQVFGCAAALLLTAMAVGSPYFLATGRLTNKPTPRRLWESPGWEEELPGNSEREARNPDDAAPRSLLHGSTRLRRLQGPLTASLLAIYAPENFGDRRLWGLYAIGNEATKGLQYVCTLLLLPGLWWFRAQFRTACGTWVVVALCLLHCLILWRVAVVVGYVSDRHVLVLVLCSVFVAVGGLFALGQLLTFLAYRVVRPEDSKGLAETNPRLLDDSGHSWLPAESGLAAATRKVQLLLILVLMGFGLQEALRPLHTNRAGHRQAGLWLAAHTVPADPVIDPFCWAHYYAGRVFWEGRAPPVPAGHVPTRYVVLEKNTSSEHSRLPTIHEATDLAARGHVVYHWPVEKPEAQAKILVYAVQP